MWPLALKIAIAVLALMLHVKAGAAVLVVIIINEIVDYFMMRSIAHRVHTERSKK